LNNNYNKNTKIKKFIEMVLAQGAKINILNIHLSTSKATKIKYFQVSRWSLSLALVVFMYLFYPQFFF